MLIPTPRRIPNFLSNSFGLKDDSAGYLSTVFSLAGFGGVLVAGFVSDRLFAGKRSFLCFLMMILMTLSFVLMATLGSTSLLFFTISMGLTGFMLYGPDSLLSGVGAIDVGGQKGALTAAGIINGMGSLGPVVQEQLIPWVYESSNRQLGPVLIILLSVAAFGTLVMFILWLRSRTGKSDL